MRLRKYLVVVASIFICIAFLRANVSAYNMAEYFPLEQGNEWTWLMTTGKFSMPLRRFIDGTESINEMETMKLKTKMMYFIPTRAYDCVASDSEGIKIYKTYNLDGTIRIYDPPKIFYPAQLDLGEIHQSSWSYTDYDKDENILSTGTGSGETSIDLVENVTVRAGTFEGCLKISDSMTEQSSDGEMIRIDSTIWLARNVWQVKVDSTWYWSHPEEGDSELAADMELICANVDGVKYSCLATSALGEDSRDNDLNILRKFRDKVLSNTPEGQELIRLYYQWSPVIVKAMEEDEKFKDEVKEMIDRLLPMIRGLVK